MKRLLIVLLLVFVTIGLLACDKPSGDENDDKTLIKEVYRHESGWSLYEFTADRYYGEVKVYTDQQIILPNWPPDLPDISDLYPKITKEIEVISYQYTNTAKLFTGDKIRFEERTYEDTYGNPDDGDYRYLAMSIKIVSVDDPAIYYEYSFNS